MIKLFIAGPQNFTNECSTQVERSDIDVRVIDTVNEPATVVGALEKYITSVDAILLGFPDEIINQFADIINRHAVTATTFVSVENLAAGYKTWTPFRFKCTRRNQEIQTIINYFANKPELLGRPVLSGPSNSRGVTLKKHSSLYVVCPSRPGFAGEVSARLSTSINGCALVCAAPDSTGALALGIPNEKLIVSDWRIPGSTAPVEWQGVQVWPIDPYKFLNIKEPLDGLIEQIRHRFDLVIVDCSGSLDICARAPKTDGVLLLRTTGELSDQAVDYWLKNYGGQNIFVMAPVEAPDIVATENGFLLLNQPENGKISTST